MFACIRLIPFLLIHYVSNAVFTVLSVFSGVSLFYGQNVKGQKPGEYCKGH